VHALERFLPNVRIEAIRRHRTIFASFRRHFASQVQAWLNDAEDDAAWRDAMVQEMHEGEQLYTEGEIAMIAKGTALLDTFATGEGRARSLRRSKTVLIAETKLDKESGLVLGHVEAEVRTMPEFLVAYLMHFDSKYQASYLNPEMCAMRSLKF
jgi:hypothetical protein